VNLQAGALANTDLWGYQKAKAIDFLKYRKIDLLLRIAAVYLILWWTILLISFAANVEVEPVPFKQYVKALLIFSTAHSGLWLASTRWAVKIRWLLLLILLVSFTFYFRLAVSKVFPTDILGIGVYLIAVGRVLVWIKNERIRQ
jgi:hypothetical protein